MGAIIDAINTAWRDHTTDGLPASGNYEPQKFIIRAIGPILESAITTAAAGGLADISFATKVNMDADLAHAAGTKALVTADTNEAYNDLWIKSGSSGSGSWALSGTNGIFHDTIEGLAQGFVDEADAIVEGLRDQLTVPTVYGLPEGEAIVSGGTAQTAAATYRWQDPMPYDFVGDTFDIYNDAGDGLTVTLRMFNADGDQITTGATYSGQKVLTLNAGANEGIDISDFFGSAGQYFGLYAQISVLSADVSKKSYIGGYWTRGGNQTTDVTTVGAGVKHMFRLRVNEDKFRGQEYATSLGQSDLAEATSYARSVIHVWEGSSYTQGNHGETPIPLLMADHLGQNRSSVINFGVGGNTVANLAARISTTIASLSTQVATGRPIVLHIDSGLVYNTVNNNAASSAGTATADIDAALTALYAICATVKAAEPSVIINISDLPKLHGTSYWDDDAHYDALVARLAATAVQSGYVDYITQVSAVSAGDDYTDATYFNPDGVHPMTALNRLFLPVYIEAFNRHFWTVQGRLFQLEATAQSAADDAARAQAEANFRETLAVALTDATITNGTRFSTTDPLVKLRDDANTLTGSTNSLRNNRACIRDTGNVDGYRHLGPKVDPSSKADVDSKADAAATATAVAARLARYGSLAAAKAGDNTGVGTMMLADRDNSIWARWDNTMEALPAEEEDYTWFEAADASKWLLSSRLVTPQMCGAAGDAKSFNPTTMKMEQNTSATDDTLAVHYALALHRRGRKLLLNRWYGIYPQTSGWTLDTNGKTSTDRSRGVPSGFIVPRVLYKVFSTTGTGTITYDGTVYNHGDTFSGQTWDDSFTPSGDALVYERVRVGPHLDMREDEEPSVSNYQRYVDIDCEKNAGLLLMEEGCALGVFGNFPNDTAAVATSKIFNSKVKLNTEALLSLYTGDVNTAGCYLSDLSHGTEIELDSHYTNVGGFLKECWNVRYDNLKWFGGVHGGYCGYVINNANSSHVVKTFFHGGRRAGFVEFVSAHGASVGDTVVVSFSGSAQFTGTVTKISSSTRLSCDKWVKSDTTALSGWTATVNGGTAAPVIDGRLLWSKGILACNAEGFQVYLDAQNVGGFGIDYLIDRDEGNSSLLVSGHIEGPSTGIIVRRSSNLIGSEGLAYFSFRGSAFAGRQADTGSEFGRLHAVDLGYVDSGVIEGWFWAKEFIASNGHATLWAASTAYDLADVVVRRHGVYICTTAGTSGTRGPVGKGTGIADGTAEWSYVRPVNNTVYVSENCRNVVLLPSTHEVNTVYNGALNLQAPQKRPVSSSKSFGSSSGTLLIDRANVTAADGSAITYRLSDYITALTEERRQPVEIEAELQMVINAAPAAGSYTGTRYFGMQFAYAGQDAENIVIERITATQAVEIGALRRQIRLTLSEYMDFTAQVINGGTGGSWDVSFQLRLRRVFY